MAGYAKEHHMPLLIGHSAKNLEEDRVLCGKRGTVKSPMENSQEGHCAGLRGTKTHKEPIGSRLQGYTCDIFSQKSIRPFKDDIQRY